MESVQGSVRINRPRDRLDGPRKKLLKKLMCLLAASGAGRSFPAEAQLLDSVRQVLEPEVAQPIELALFGLINPR